MEFGNLIMVMFFSYYTYKIINMFRVGTKNIKYNNQLLNKYRGKKVLTLKEQKEFLNIKFGKKVKRKFRWMSVFNFILTMIILIPLFMFYNFLITYFNLTISLWMAILMIIVLPIFISLFLGLFGLRDNNMLLDIFWRKDKK